MKTVCGFDFTLNSVSRTAGKWVSSSRPPWPSISQASVPPSAGRAVIRVPATRPVVQASEKSFTFTVPISTRPGNKPVRKPRPSPFVGLGGGFDRAYRRRVGGNGMRGAEGGVETFGGDALDAPGAVPEGVQVEPGAELFDGEFGEGTAGVAGGVERLGVDFRVLPVEGLESAIGAERGGGFAVEEMAEVVAAQEAGHPGARGQESDCRDDQQHRKREQQERAQGTGLGGAGDRGHGSNIAWREPGGERRDEGGSGKVHLPSSVILSGV